MLELSSKRKVINYKEDVFQNVRSGHHEPSTSPDTAVFQLRTPSSSHAPEDFPPLSTLLTYACASQHPHSPSLPGKSTGVGSHILLQRIFPTQGSNLCLLHWQVDSSPLSHQRSPTALYWHLKTICSCIMLFTDFISGEYQRHYEIFIINQGSVSSEKLRTIDIGNRESL